MIELWGEVSCEACNIARDYMNRTPLNWKYVDVKTTGFEGMIPRLVLDDGQELIDLPAIKNYIRQWMEAEGFPPEMINNVFR